MDNFVSEYPTILFDQELSLSNGAECRGQAVVQREDLAPLGLVLIRFAGV